MHRANLSLKLVVHRRIRSPWLGLAVLATVLVWFGPAAASGQPASAAPNGPDQRAAAQQAAEEAYEQLWAARERDARTREEQAKLAGDILAEARKMLGVSHRLQNVVTPFKKLSAEEQAKVLHWCDKTFEWGRRCGAYAHAADALDIIDQTSPRLRLEALSRLEELYERAYRLNPSKNLGLGKGLASVQIQVAKQMQVKLRGLAYTRNFDDSEFHRTLNLTKLKFVTAMRTTNVVQGTAERYARNSSVSDANRAALHRLAGELEMIRKTAEEGRDVTMEVDKLWRQNVLTVRKLLKDEETDAAALHDTLAQVIDPLGAPGPRLALATPQDNDPARPVRPAQDPPAGANDPQDPAPNDPADPQPKDPQDPADPAPKDPADAAADDAPQFRAPDWWDVPEPPADAAAEKARRSIFDFGNN